MKNTVKENLIARGYKVSVFAQACEAASYLCTAIRNTTVGIGGSVTIRDMGLYESLAQSNRVFWHWHPQEGHTSAEMLEGAGSAAVYLSSVNALSEQGEIVNIDGNGNRVAGIFYGHKKVYLIVGENKIAPSLPDAIDRARNVAAPQNAVRLGRHTPCALKGDHCYDCNSPDRICKGVQVLLQAPSAAEYEVVLIGENLGY